MADRSRQACISGRQAGNHRARSARVCADAERYARAVERKSGRIGQPLRGEATAVLAARGQPQSLQMIRQLRKLAEPSQLSLVRLVLVE